MAKGWGDAWRSWTPAGWPNAERDTPRRRQLLTDIRQKMQDAVGRPSLPKPAKYHNVKTVTWDGVICDSKKEAARWEQLRALQSAGQIVDLLPHPSFPLFVNGTRTGRFTGDALYVEGGRLVLEDTKSTITAKATAYRQRVRTFQACYPHITFREYRG